jgi:hypothetical protein
MAILEGRNRLIFAWPRQPEHSERVVINNWQDIEACYGGSARIDFNPLRR